MIMLLSILLKLEFLGELSSNVSSRICSFSSGYLALLAANNLLLMREVSMGVEIDFSINLDANSNFYPA